MTKRARRTPASSRLGLRIVGVVAALAVIVGCESMSDWVNTAKPFGRADVLTAEMVTSAYGPKGGLLTLAITNTSKERIHWVPPKTILTTTVPSAAVIVPPSLARESLVRNAPQDFGLGYSNEETITQALAALTEDIWLEPGSTTQVTFVYSRPDSALVHFPIDLSPVLEWQQDGKSEGSKIVFKSVVAMINPANTRQTIIVDRKSVKLPVNVSISSDDI